jgi:hypothetical protein
LLIISVAQETADGELVVFHDEQSIGRVCIDTTSAAGHHRIRDMTVHEVKTLTLRRPPAGKVSTNVTTSGLSGKAEAARVPTLAEFLEKVLALGLTKPVVVEIKSIRTDAAREAFLRLLHSFAAQRKVIDFGQGFDFPSAVNVLAFPGNFIESFGIYGTPQWRYWRRRFHEADVRGVQCPVLHFIDHQHFSSGAWLMALCCWLRGLDDPRGW